VLALKIMVTVLALWLVLRRVDSVPTVGAVAWKANWGWLVAGLAIQFIVSAMNAMRWRELVPIAETPLRKYLYYVFVGHFLNLFLPSAALAEGARTYAFGRKYGGMQRNFAAALVARASGVAVQ